MKETYRAVGKRQIMSESQAVKIPSGISRNVVILGFVSFFNDIASEMIYPIVPLFLTSVLGAPASVVGLVEGIAESTASVAKMLFGWLSDRYGRRKIFVFFGYSFSGVSKFILSLAGSWPFVLFARFIDRSGKGVRTAARDALIAESTAPESRGKAFGFHRSLDTMGAVVGPLLALAAINFLHDDYRRIFFLAFIPSVVAVLLIVFVRGKPRQTDAAKPVRWRWRNLDPAFKTFLFISFIFALGNSSDAFLILRAKDLGLSVTLTVLAYVLFNLVYTAVSTPAGALADRVGARRVLTAGFFFFAVVYFLFGIIDRSLYLWLLFPMYGIYMALTEGIGKAYISSLVPADRIGTAYGVYNTTVGLCAFFASFAAGLLWTYIGVSAPFIFGSILALIAGMMFLIIRVKRG